MAHIVEVLPNDAEIEAITAPQTRQSVEELQHRRDVRRKLEDCLERLQLRQMLGLEDDDVF